MGAWPTNDGLTMIYTAWPVAEFHAFRADVEGNYLKTIQLAPGLAERAGQRVEPIRGTADLPNFLRKPYGQGWALVGDAGLVQDPITGAGISDAFRDAGLLVEALEAGLSGREPLEQALARYEQQRNEAALPLYQFTLETASMRPPTPEQQQLLSALRGNHEATDQFFGVLTGAVSPKEFFAPSNLLRIMGFRGMAKIMAQRLLPVRKRNSIATPPLQA
jgi:hypothetical protein